MSKVHGFQKLWGPQVRKWNCNIIDDAFNGLGPPAAFVELRLTFFSCPLFLLPPVDNQHTQNKKIAKAMCLCMSGASIGMGCLRSTDTLGTRSIRPSITRYNSIYVVSRYILSSIPFNFPPDNAQLLHQQGGLWKKHVGIYAIFNRLSK